MCGLLPTSRKKRKPMLLIDLKIVVQAASGFFDVGPSLIKGQWKVRERHHNRGRFGELGIRGLALRSPKQELRSLHQAHAIHFDGRGKRAHRSSPCRKQETPVAPRGETFTSRFFIKRPPEGHEPWTWCSSFWESKALLA